MYIVVMIGMYGNEYRTPCDNENEAVRLMQHHVNLGFNAWIEEGENE